MRTFFSFLFITLLTFGLFVNEASAKRFGGGRSFGVQRSQSSFFKQNTPHNTSSLGQKAGTNKWGGVLGGLLVGGLLASLFMGNGFANGLMTWLIVGAAAFFLIQFFRRKMQPAMQANQPAGFGQNNFSHFTKTDTNTPSSNSHYSDYPSGFNEADFLRQAKVTFIRLQSAYDQKNLQDLTAFTAPEVFAEIKMQLDERGDEPNNTEVITLEAQLLDVSKQSLSTLASVRFTGSIKENNDPLSPLDEIWHFRQFSNNNEWVIGGIQQDVVQPL